MATVSLEREGTAWHMRRQAGAAPYESDDPDTQRIWWKDVGVHQKPHVPGAARSGVGNALLAPGRPRHCGARG